MVLNLRDKIIHLICKAAAYKSFPTRPINRGKHSSASTESCNPNFSTAVSKNCDPISPQTIPCESLLLVTSYQFILKMFENPAYVSLSLYLNILSGLMISAASLIMVPFGTFLISPYVYKEIHDHCSEKKRYRVFP